MADYECIFCGAATTRGSLVGYSDGSFIAVPLCPNHRDVLKSLVKEGTHVMDASKSN